MRGAMTVVIVVGLGFAAVPSYAQQPCCALRGADQAAAHRVESIGTRRFTHAAFWNAVAPYLQNDALRVTAIGQSLQGRAIRAVTFGRGPTRVLFWSQMHGDESTATMALADLMRFFADGGNDVLRRLIEDRLTVVMVPMLNPDGAERFQRYNAAGVDVNRDARRLATPEARALKALRDSVQPMFGFNLHDQNARTTAGDRGAQVAIALLAPAADAARSWGPVRTRARHLAALLAAALAEELPGRIAKYDDTFEPRAFGDLIQQWGTSTILIESGALPDDPDKQALRRINATALLTALEAIATQRWEGVHTAPYDDLPFNERVVNDLLLLGGHVVVPGREPLRLDLALDFEDPVARTHLVLGEIGDLAGATAMDTVDAAGRFLHVEAPAAFDPADWWLLRGERVAVTVRRGADAESAVVVRLPD